MCLNDPPGQSSRPRQREPIWLDVGIRRKDGSDQAGADPRANHETGLRNRDCPICLGSILDGKRHDGSEIELVRRSPRWPWQCELPASQATANTAQARDPASLIGSIAGWSPGTATRDLQLPSTAFLGCSCFRISPSTSWTKPPFATSPSTMASTIKELPLHLLSLDSDPPWMSIFVKTSTQRQAGTN